MSPTSRRVGVRLRSAVAVVATLALVSACTSTTDGIGSTASGAASSGPTAFPSASVPGSAAPSSPSAASQPAASFGSCSQYYNTSAVELPSDRAGKLEFSCARIQVPLDYAKPTGSRIALELVRIHDKDTTKPKGSLLLNPGGPGGGGNVFALGYAAEIPLNLLQNFDVVGFDPRGVGDSTPVHCLTDAQKDMVNADSPDMRTTAGFDHARATALMVANACAAKVGAALPYYNTVNTARDMDQIRQAVGDKQFNYLGFSYGTELGAAYAHLFPGTVRVMVLDGAVNPLTADIVASTDQLQGFEQSFDQFAAYCRTHSPCKSLGDPRKATEAIQATSMKTPIPTSAAGDDRVGTFALITTGVLSALYSQSQWPTLGQALVSAKNGNSAGLLALADSYNERYDGQYTNVADANLTINCNDTKAGTTDATIRATTTSWIQKFPIFGLWSAPTLFSCQQWQPTRTVPPLPVAKTLTKVLVVGNLHDPATPYQGAVDLARVMGNAELLSWNGEGHTSFTQGSSCIDGYVEQYLINSTLPPVNKTCPR